MFFHFIKLKHVLPVSPDVQKVNATPFDGWPIPQKLGGLGESRPWRWVPYSKHKPKKPWSSYIFIAWISLFHAKEKKNMLDSKITFLFLSFMGRSRFFMDSLPMFHSKNHCFMVKSVLFMLKSPFVVVTSRFFTVKSLCFMDSIPIFMVKLWKIQFFRWNTMKSLCLMVKSLFQPPDRGENSHRRSQLSQAFQHGPSQVRVCVPWRGNSNAMRWKPKRIPARKSIIYPSKIKMEH